ncbi:hypothetical protein, partial [Klebsiella pneumoniae]
RALFLTANALASADLITLRALSAHKNAASVGTLGNIRADDGHERARLFLVLIETAVAIKPPSFPRRREFIKVVGCGSVDRVAGMDSRMRGNDDSTS